MGDKAHIGLVDAHSKGDGSHHNHAIVAQEPVLVALAHLGIQPGVVGHRVDAGLDQRLCHVLYLSARLAVHNAGLAFMFALDKAQQLLRAIALFHNRVADVGPIEAADEGAGILQLQSLQNIGAGQGIGRGGERHARHTREPFMQHC